MSSEWGDDDGYLPVPDGVVPQGATLKGEPVERENGSAAVRHGRTGKPIGAPVLTPPAASDDLPVMAGNTISGVAAAARPDPDAWSFSYSDGPAHLSLEEAVFQALGGASACWENLRGAGVFQSDQAKQIGELLVEWVWDWERRMRAADPQTPMASPEPADHQVDRLGRWIMENVPGEPSRSQGAVDTAIRLLAGHADLDRLAPAAAADLARERRYERASLVRDLLGNGVPWVQVVAAAKTIGPYIDGEPASGWQPGMTTDAIDLDEDWIDRLAVTTSLDVGTVALVIGAHLQQINESGR